MDHIKTQIIKMASFLYGYKELEVTIAQHNRRYYAFVSRTDTDNLDIKDIENGWGYTEESAVENLSKTLSETLTTKLENAEEKITYLERTKENLVILVNQIKNLKEETEKTQ